MPLEIERKFLTVNEGWREEVRKNVHIRDGLVANCNGRKVRVRIQDDVATITLKSERESTTRSEFEYEIPVRDAEEILRVMCGEHLLQKMRYFVPHHGLTWVVDVYEGLLAGVVLAEVELTRADQPIDLPGWIGREVTRDPRYRKASMFAERMDALRARSVKATLSNPKIVPGRPPVLEVLGL